MVGKIFKVVFSNLARKRRREVFDFEKRRVNTTHARSVNSDIGKAARGLKKLPGSKPLLPKTEDESDEFRYTKARNYKIIFKVLKKIGSVLIITIRSDEEDYDEVLDDVK